MKRSVTAPGSVRWSFLAGWHPPGSLLEEAHHVLVPVVALVYVWLAARPWDGRR